MFPRCLCSARHESLKNACLALGACIPALNMSLHILHLAFIADGPMLADQASSSIMSDFIFHSVDALPVSSLEFKIVFIFGSFVPFPAFNALTCEDCSVFISALLTTKVRTVVLLLMTMHRRFMYVIKGR